MEENYTIEFFSDNTLKGSKFYFYCNHMKKQDRELITNLIKEYDGVNYIYNYLYNIANITKINKK